MAFEGEAVSPIDRIAHPKVGGIYGNRRVDSVRAPLRQSGVAAQLPYKFLDLFGKAWRTSSPRSAELCLVGSPGRPGSYPCALMLEPLGLAKCQSFPVKFSYQGGGPGFGLPSRHGWEPRSKSTKARSTICPHQVRSFFKTWPRYPEPPSDPVEPDQAVPGLASRASW